MSIHLWKIFSGLSPVNSAIQSNARTDGGSHRSGMLKPISQFGVYHHYSHVCWTYSTGWWFQPLWKIWLRQLRWCFPLYGKKNKPPTIYSIKLVVVMIIINYNNVNYHHNCHVWNIVVAYNQNYYHCLFMLLYVTMFLSSLTLLV